MLTLVRDFTREVHVMFRDLRSFKYLLILVSLAIIVGSCSGGDFIISPDFGLQTGTRKVAGQASHQCWGLYDIYISADRTVWDFVPRRMGMSHLNLVRLLEGQTNYVTIPDGGLVFEDEYIACTVQIEHPLVSIPDVFEASEFTGFDVKGIVMFPGTKEYPATGIITQDILGNDGKVLNAEGYSRWWNPVEFAEGEFLETYVEGKMGLFPGTSNLINATVHPYRWIYPGMHRHSFKPTKVAQTTYNIVLPAEGEPFALMYAIDASYTPPIHFKPPDGPDPVYKLSEFPITANQPEPYMMSVTSINNYMWSDGITEGKGDCFIEIDVYDWQDPRFFKDTLDEDRGVRRPFIEAPDLFDGIVKFELLDSTPNAEANATTTHEPSFGVIPEGSLIINGLTAGYSETTAGNSRYDNVVEIVDDLNDIDDLEVAFTAIFTDDEKAFFHVEHRDGGPFYKIKIQNTPNLPWLGLDSLDNAQLIIPGPDDEWPSYYLINNGIGYQTWTGEISNVNILTPGNYQALIGCPDYAEYPLFPSEEHYPTTYWMIILEVAEKIQFLCDDHEQVHSNYLGITTIVNGLPEYRADCDFIGYTGSEYYGKLLFNKGTQFPDGPQEIAVLDADSQGVMSAYPIITIEDSKKGIPLILQEDEVTGNIIVVNHIYQDNILVFDHTGEFLNSFDHYGDGDDGLNSPIALDFDEDGDMWLVSHRGSTGPELRHWLWNGSGSYINAPNDLVDLAPIFGTGYNIIDLKVEPFLGRIYIFANTENGRIEVFDYTQSPPVLIEDLSMLWVFDAPITQVNYPGLRICGGGDLIIDRNEPELALCRAVAAANLTTGPLGMQKIDSFGNKLDYSSIDLSHGALCLALNNDPNVGTRSVVIFPIAMTNNFVMYGPPIEW